ncbi:MAG: MATE family efflux transporter [Desulfarculaceae bacterium]
MIKRWSQVGGYKEVLAIGLPLVMSMASTTIMQFTDRVFLAGYSVDAIAAALPAGITSFLFMSFFMGVAGYLNVFVAQYTGSGQRERVGASLWQGIYFCLLAVLVLAGLYFFAKPLFSWGGHPAEVERLEIVYFKILTLGSGLGVLGMGLSCFYSGRGLTRPVMLVNMAGAVVNIPLDYALINGVWFFPEMGIAGAGVATVTAWAVIAGIFAWLIFTKENNRRFAVWRSRAFDRELFMRLLRFGLPGGIEFFVGMSAITFFSIMVGRLGKLDLAASNIAISLDTIAFLPMIGFHVAIQTMVGQAIGRGRPQDGVEATKSTMHITMSYMAVMGLVFILFPEWLMELFRSRDYTGEEFEYIVETGVVLLRFVAAYTLLDALHIIYAGAIKGAGDTYFVMWTVGIVSLVVMIIPIYLMVVHFGAGLYSIWFCLTLFVAFLGTIFWWRYRQGKWQTMSVIKERN